MSSMDRFEYPLHPNSNMGQGTGMLLYMLRPLDSLSQTRLTNVISLGTFNEVPRALA